MKTKENVVKLSRKDTFQFNIEFRISFLMTFSLSIELEILPSRRRQEENNGKAHEARFHLLIKHSTEEKWNKKKMKWTKMLKNKRKEKMKIFFLIGIRPLLVLIHISFLPYLMLALTRILFFNKRGNEMNIYEKALVIIKINDFFFCYCWYKWWKS